MVLRSVGRDLGRGRLSLQQERASELLDRPHNGQFQLSQTNPGLDREASAELIDIMSYLTDTILHSRVTYFKMLGGKRYPPLVLFQHKWHVTHPGDGWIRLD